MLKKPEVKPEGELVYNPHLYRWVKKEDYEKALALSERDRIIGVEKIKDRQQKKIRDKL